MDLVNVVDNFCRRYCKRSDKLLIGLSGGSDSLALLYLFLELKSRYKFDLHVAHIDHGWRSNSCAEAKKLKELANSLKLPFYTKKLCPSSMEGNLEDCCRVERFKYFSYLCNKHDLKAVLLGHHSDDRSETVLKRVFEGASLMNLSGFSEEGIINGLTVLRPLISTSKTDIVSWLECQGLSYFDDETNRDNRFLRARLRNEIIPFLSEKFGKEITKNLFQIGDNSKELKEYFERKVSHYKIICGHFGQLLDLTQSKPEEKLEMRFLLKKFCLAAGITASRSVLDTMQNILMKGNKVIEIAGKKMIIDRGRLFILQKDFPVLQTEEISHKTKSYNDWKIIVDKSKKTSWLDIWQGNIFVNKLNCTIGPSDLKSRYRGTELGRWYTNNKVPSFMRTKIPVLWKDNLIIQEFLTE